MTATAEPYTGRRRSAASPQATACWRWSGLRASSIRNWRSSPSCVRRGTRSRSRSSSQPPRSARSPLLASVGSPLLHDRRLAADALVRYFAWRFASHPHHNHFHRWPPDLPGRGVLEKRRRWHCLPRSEIRWPSTRSRNLPAMRTPFLIRGGEGVFPPPKLLHKTEAERVCCIADRRTRSEVSAIDRARPRGTVLYWYRKWNGPCRGDRRYRDDPVRRPIVLVGAGGTLAEIYKDYALKLAPVSEESGRDDSRRGRGSRRGAATADCRAAMCARWRKPSPRSRPASSPASR